MLTCIFYSTDLIVHFHEIKYYTENNFCKCDVYVFTSTLANISKIYHFLL